MGGSYVDVDVSGNTVTLNGGNVYTNIEGGGFIYAGTGNGNVTGNIVTINYGSLGSAYGGSSYYGNATNNTLIINGGIFNGGSDFAYGGRSDYGDANGNTVIVNDGFQFKEDNIARTVWGGHSSIGNAIIQGLPISTNIQAA